MGFKSNVCPPSKLILAYEILILSHTLLCFLQQKSVLFFHHFQIVNLVPISTFDLDLVRKASPQRTSGVCYQAIILLIFLVPFVCWYPDLDVHMTLNMIRHFQEWNIYVKNDLHWSNSSFSSCFSYYFSFSSCFSSFFPSYFSSFFYSFYSFCDSFFSYFAYSALYSCFPSFYCFAYG